MNSPDTPPQNVCRAARSPEELFPLIDFCRAGKLKEVSEWIAAGKPLDPPQTAKKRSRRRQSPFDIAIEKGFFTLAEMLLDAGCDPRANGNALHNAVEKSEPEIARLLLERGVPIDSVYPSSVFDAGRPMIELFISHGFDPSAECAFYEALCCAVHPLLFLLKEYKERFPDLQQQANRALCYHCEKGSPRNVGLLLWAGAQPDVEVPDPKYSDCATSALEAAARSGRVEILKQLKPQNYPRVLPTLIPNMWFNASRQTIDYLVGIGAPLNTNVNGGCELIDHLLSQIGHYGSGLFGQPNGTEITNTLATIEHICRIGAKWIPDAERFLRDTRYRLRKIEGRHVVELFRIFKETGAASVELLDSIIASPSFRKLLGTNLQSIDRILRPPLPKVVTVARDRSSDDSKEKPPPPTPAELRTRAEALLLDVIRQQPDLHFKDDSTSEVFDGKQIRKRLGLPKDDDHDLQSIVDGALKKLNTRLCSFRLNAEWWSRFSCKVTATLSETAEWPEAIQEAWSFGENVNDSFLTDTAVRLREVILSGSLGTDWVSERSITYKIGLWGRERVLAEYLQELENKTDLNFKWEQDGKGWGVDPHRFRIVVNEGARLRAEIPAVANPRIGVRFDACRKQDRDAFQKLLYEQLLKAQPDGNSPFVLLSISTRKDLEKCLPHFTSIESIARFFGELPIDKSLTIHYDFRESTMRWFVGVEPRKDWAASLEAISQHLSRPSLAEQYGISSDAGKLLEWIQGLPAKCFTGLWTPVVEEARDNWIGISCPWSEENFAAYLQMLLDEINQNTEYQLTLQPWQQHGRVKSRIRVKQKRADVDEVVRQIQLLALGQGLLLDARLARDAIEKLIKPENPVPPE